KPRSLRLEVRKLRLKIFLPLPRSNTRRTCCCPGHSTRKPRSYRLEARTLHLDPGLLPPGRTPDDVGHREEEKP
ncbi:unnamed protein product, partial [Nesidiocoris tenuis]